MSIESQARWYATKVILIYLSVITSLVVIAYINLFYMAVLMATLFALMIASAIFSDAYYSKLLELNKGRWNDQSRTD